MKYFFVFFLGISILSSSLNLHFSEHHVENLRSLKEDKMETKNQLNLSDNLPDLKYEPLTKDDRLKFDPLEVYRMVEGILLGLKFTDYDQLLSCIEDFNSIGGDIAIIIAYIEYIEGSKSVTYIIYAIGKIFETLGEIFDLIEPCAGIQDDMYLHYLIKKIKETNIEQVAIKILIQGGPIYIDLINIGKDYKNHDYQSVGLDIGDIAYQILVVP